MEPPSTTPIMQPCQKEPPPPLSMCPSEPHTHHEGDPTESHPNGCCCDHLTITMDEYGGTKNGVTDDMKSISGDALGPCKKNEKEDLGRKNSDVVKNANGCHKLCSADGLQHHMGCPHHINGNHNKMDDDEKIREIEKQLPQNSCLPKLPCLDYHTSPDYLREEYVMHGYRPDGMHWALIAPSLFQLHNETWNIWTHLLGFLIIAAIILYTLCTPLPTTNEYAASKIPILFFLFSLDTVLAISTLFHWFLCTNERVHRNLRAIDWSAIPMLIAGSMFAIIYYLFPADRTMSRNMYLSSTLVFGAVAAVIPYIPKFQNPQYRVAHCCALVCLAFSGGIPLVHLAAVGGRVGSQLLEFTLRLAVSGLFYLVGAGFYLSRIPERYVPPAYFMRWHIGYSHNLFHVGVVLGGLTTYWLLIWLCQLPPQ